MFDSTGYKMVASKREWIPEWLFGMFKLVIPYQPFRWIFTVPASVGVGSDGDTIFFGAGHSSPPEVREHVPRPVVIKAEPLDTPVPVVPKKPLIEKLIPSGRKRKSPTPKKDTTS